MVRTPLFPLGDLMAMGEGLLVPPSVPDIELDAAVVADRSLLRRRLAAFFERPEAREALFVASPSLEAGVAAWRAEPGSDRGARIERGLVRYLARMTARGTPYGLLAGWSLAEVGPRTQLELAGRAADRRWSRIDLHVLGRLVERAITDERVRRGLRLRPNPTLRPVGGSLRFVEPREDGAGRHLFLSSATRTPWLDAALARAAEGDGVLLTELAAHLARSFEVEADEGADFVHALVEARVLVPDIEIRVTGAPPHQRFAADLRRSPGTAPWADAIEAAGGLLGALDAAGLGNAPARYREALRPLEALPVELDPGILVQVDLARPGRMVLGDEVVLELGRAIDALCRLVPHREPAELRAFRESFLRRYGDAEVPLLEVLDEDGGLGFAGSAAQERAPSPLLDGIPFPGVGDPAAPAGVPAAVPGAVPDTTDETGEPLAWGGPASRLILSRYAKALATGAVEIELTPSEIAALPPAGDPAPDALAAFATLLARDPDAANGDFLLFLRLALGPPAGALAARFCHQDPDLASRVRALSQAEAAWHPGAVLAEVVHLPEGRVGNVVCRPVLLDAEIPWLSSPGVAADRTYPPQDLLLSVREGRLRLRSRRDGREILPRLTTAHGYEHGTGVYRFLGTLQSQGTRPKVRFSWGALADAPFLPRVRIGRVVVFPASWRLGPAEIASVSGTRDPAVASGARGPERVRAVRALRRERGLPRRVLAGEGDNETAVDLEDALSVESFAHLLRGKETIRVSEIPYDLAPSAVRGPDGRYANELVVPMLRRRDPGTGPSAGSVSGTGSSTGPSTGPSPPTRHPPGSEWLYARVFCGPAGADEVLLQAVAPLARDLLTRGVADRWYFLRYGDPDWHLRLRFHGDPARLRRDGFEALHATVAPLLGSGLVDRLTLDTHEPEAERYGGPAALPLAEAWFQADSDAALATLAALAEEGRDGERGLAALEAVVRTWQEMGLQGDALREALLRSRDAFRAEHRAGTALLRATGARYRSVETRIRELLPAEDGTLGPARPGSPLAVRAAATRPLAEAYRRLAASGSLSAPLADVAWSLAHLSANRLLAMAARRHELVIHELACRHLEALRHRR